MGFLPEALRNYLLRLGWAHGDDEIISTEQAIAWFDLDGVGRAPARLDMAKLLSVNAHWLRERPDADLVALIRPRLERMGLSIDAGGERRLLAGMSGLKQRARTLVELAESAAFYVRPRPLLADARAAKALEGPVRHAVGALAERLAAVEPWTEQAIEAACREAAGALDVPFGKLAQGLRAALTGSTVSPGLFEVVRVLGPTETAARIEDAAQGRSPTTAA
jgi:glutamyl-tRNA synthetase